MMHMVYMIMTRLSHTKYWSITTLVVIVLTLFPIQPQQTSYAAAPSASSVVTINGGGGVATDGSDGIRMTFNVARFGEQIKHRNDVYAYLGGEMGFHLNVGGTLYTSMNGSRASRELSGADTFDDLVIGNLTGTASTSGGSTTGDGSAVLTYTKTISTRVYTVVRSIKYTFPNRYYKESYKVIIPVGNTGTVKLYKGGDTAPGQTPPTGDYDKEAHGMLTLSPMRDVTSVETDSQAIFGMREVLRSTSMSTFQGAVAQYYTHPYPSVVAGGDIGEYAQNDLNDPTNTHDAGFMIQHTLGSAAGTYTVENLTYVGKQAVNLEATWLDESVSGIGHLYLTLNNSMLSNASGLGYTFTLPAGLVFGGINNTCGATVSVSGSTLTVSGAAVNALENCVIDFDVGATANATYTITSSSASGLTGTGIENAVGKSSVTFTGISPTFTITPTFTNTSTPTQTATRTATATNTPTNTRTSTPTRTNTPTPTDTSTPTETSTSTFTLTPTDTSTPTNTPTSTDTPTPTDTFTPSLTPRPNQLRNAAIGNLFVIGLLNNGTLVTWGSNNFQQSL